MTKINENPPRRSEFLHVEGQTDVGKLVDAISELFDATTTKITYTENVTTTYNKHTTKIYNSYVNSFLFQFSAYFSQDKYTNLVRPPSLLDRRNTLISFKQILTKLSHKIS